MEEFFERILKTKKSKLIFSLLVIGVFILISLSIKNFLEFKTNYASTSFESAKAQVIEKHQKVLKKNPGLLETPFAQEIEEERKLLPEDFSKATVYPFKHPNHAESGVTNLVTCEIWINPVGIGDHLLDVLRHEYFHFKQCEMFNGNKKKIYEKFGNDQELERIADAGAIILGATYTQYTHNPTHKENTLARELLNYGYF